MLIPNPLSKKWNPLIACAACLIFIDKLDWEEIDVFRALTSHHDKDSSSAHSDLREIQFLALSLKESYTDIVSIINLDLQIIYGT